jgi:hypothetical protein
VYQRVNGTIPLALAAATTLAPAAESAMDESMGGMRAGTRVQSPAGEAIGTVEDIIPDARTGRPGYVLIATTSGLKTAVPYSAIVPKMHDGRIVMDRSGLEGAPSVRDVDLQDLSNTVAHPGGSILEFQRIDALPGQNHSR